MQSFSHECGLYQRCKTHLFIMDPSADPEGGTGGPDPPGKSQVIWVSIGNKQLEKVAPPLLENVGPPLKP